MPIVIDKIGLKKYLNSTKDLHNGQGYNDLIDKMELKVPITEIAKAFGVRRDTIYSWIRRLV